MATKLGPLEKIYVRRVTNMLVDKGKEIVARAIATKKPTEGSENQTLTQVDSYGLIIYYNGKVQRSMIGDVNSWGGRYKSPEPYNITPSMKSKYKRFSDDPAEGTTHKGWAAMGIPAASGFEWAKMFVREFRKTNEVPQNGFALVVFNAAFYSRIQEEGSGSLKRSYKVLSQVIGDLDDVAKDFSGATVRKINLP